MKEAKVGKSSFYLKARHCERLQVSIKAARDLGVGEGGGW